MNTPGFDGPGADRLPPITPCQPPLSLPAARGLAWLREGWQLCRRHWLIWLAASSLFMLAVMVLSALPFGGLILLLLAQVMVAGFISLAHVIHQDLTPTMRDLLAGFRRQTARLISLGALQGLLLVVLLVLLASQLQSLLGTETLTAIQAAVTANDRAALMTLLEPHMPGILKTLGFGLLLYLPIWAALWFAPALILFHGVPPLLALKTSLQACIRNLGAFLVFGLLLLGWCSLIVFVIGLLTAFLPLLAFLPSFLAPLLFAVVTASTYVSFVQVFPQVDMPVDVQGDDGMMDMTL